MRSFDFQFQTIINSNKKKSFLSSHFNRSIINSSSCCRYHCYYYCSWLKYKKQITISIVKPNFILNIISDLLDILKTEIFNYKAK